MRSDEDPADQDFLSQDFPKPGLPQAKISSGPGARSIGYSIIAG
jgi:hypothetical protein